jgi:DNA primase
MTEVEDIKSRLEIADVVGGYVQLKQAGRNLKAPCPFHQEKSASFMVSPEKGIFHCFGCGQGGDVFQFVMLIEGLDFRGALEQLARRAGVELKSHGRPKENTDRLYQALEMAVKYFQTTLVRNPPALSYVTGKRHLGKETIRDFMIGYSPDSWEALSGFLLGKGFTADELLRAGLAGQRPGRSSLYDLYRGRIMFTICDRSGRPIGFTGRVMDDSLPKYLNTPQTVLYDKSRAIYGLHLAKEAIRTNDEAVLVEGNVDVIASHQAGVRQVVAASGTALTLDQLKTLSHLSKNVKLCFDADRAGLAATERAIPLAQKLGLNLYVVEIEGAKDPDELIATDVEAWKTAIRQAREIREYWYLRSKIEFQIDGSPSGVDKIQFVKRMASILRLYDDDSAAQMMFIDHMALETGIDAKIFLTAIADYDKHSSAPINKSLSYTVAQPNHQSSAAARSATADAGRRFVPQPPPPKPTARVHLEASVMALNLVFPEARLSLEDLRPSDFADPRHEAVFSKLKRLGSEATLDHIAQALPDEADYVKILALQGEEEYADTAPADRSFEAFTLARRLIELASHDTKINLSKRIREAEESSDHQLAKELLTEYQALLTEER